MKSYNLDEKTKLEIELELRKFKKNNTPPISIFILIINLIVFFLFVYGLASLMAYYVNNEVQKKMLVSNIQNTLAENIKFYKVSKIYDFNSPIYKIEYDTHTKVDFLEVNKDGNLYKLKNIDDLILKCENNLEINKEQNILNDIKNIYIVKKCLETNINSLNREKI